MTKTEALKIWLPVIKMGVETMPECEEALDMAISALSQTNNIEKIRREIETKMNLCREKGTVSYGFRGHVLKEVLDIIDKHLSEVEGKEE